jgi:cell division protein FtsI/penicillin-binding protein 2
LIQLQIQQRHEVLLSARRQHVKWIPLLARRGFILDRRGRILAGSNKAESLFADPKIISDKRAAALYIGPLIGQDPVKLWTRLERAGEKRFIWLKRCISPKIVKRIKKLKSKLYAKGEGDILRGIGFISHEKRNYPANTLASHVLGFVGEERRGLEGLELKYDSYLAGKDGYQTFVADVKRRPVWLEGDKYAPPEDGDALVLTLDMAIQDIVERELTQTCKDFDAESGCAVVMEPRTGEVLAMANYPTYEPGNYRRYPASNRRNRCITDPVEPGSTFKCFAAAAALDSNVAGLQDPINCHNGVYAIKGRRLHDHHPYGVLTFLDVVVKSSNIGMAIIGQRVGSSRLYAAIRRFGFGRTTGIEIPGESSGVVMPFPKWSYYTLSSVPMGHEISVTPIQLASAFCAFANNGNVPRPRITRFRLNENGKLLEDYTHYSTLMEAVRPTVANMMASKVLCEVVKRGTGRRAKIEGVEIFGKTGTAQLVGESGRYESGSYLASFIAGGPLDNPQLVVLMMIRKPDADKGYYGGTVSAPAVKRIFVQVLDYMNIDGPTMLATTEGGADSSENVSWGKKFDFSQASQR